MRPVLVTAWPAEAARLLFDLLVDYQATLTEGAGEGDTTISIEPVDSHRRGTVIYRVIQAARTVDERHPGSRLYLITEDGNRWRLPPPAI